MEAIAEAFTTPYNPNTKRAYRIDVEQFFETPIEKITIGQVLSVTSAKAREYRDKMKANGLANATVHRRIVFVRKFYDFLHRQGHIPSNPFDPKLVELPKKSEDEIVVMPLTDAEVDAIMRQPNKKTWNGRRNYTLMAFALMFGLRRAELARLRTEHFKRDPSSGSLVFTIAAKGSKPRTCKLRQSLEFVLRYWLLKRGDYDGPLFPASRINKYNPIDGVHIRNAIHRCARKAGIQFRERSPSEKRTSGRWHVSTHSFRATAIHVMHRSGLPIEDIANIVGHSDPAITWRYLKRANSLDPQQSLRAAEPFDHFISQTFDREA